MKPFYRKCIPYYYYYFKEPVASKTSKAPLPRKVASPSPEQMQLSNDSFLAQSNSNTLFGEQKIDNYNSQTNFKKSNVPLFLTKYSPTRYISNPSVNYLENTISNLIQHNNSHYRKNNANSTERLKKESLPDKLEIEEISPYDDLPSFAYSKLPEYAPVKNPSILSKPYWE